MSLGLILACLASQLHAVDAPDSIPRGYAGLRLLYAISDFDIDLAAGGSGVEAATMDGVGVGVVAGWWLNRWVALELDLHIVPSLALALTEPIDDEIGNAWVLTVIPALRLRPLAEVLPRRLSLSGLLGAGTLLTGGTWSVGMSDRSATGATLALHFAGGLDVRLAPNLFFSVEGGYVLAPADLRVEGIRLRPNLVLAAAGFTLLF